ncbi:MAG: hypothetical protein DLM63_07940 [Solirubrobacterales bacterium]|nr:MAG: hypothetical protein DLM63_07940 [Solirubrobacterales bacterium]
MFVVKQRVIVIAIAVCALVGVVGCGGGSGRGPGRASTAVSVGSPPLRGTLMLPARAAGRVPALVLMSGSGPHDQDETVGASAPFRDLAAGLAARGIATLRYDKRTFDYPASVDARTFTAQDEYVPDALAAVAVLRARPEIDPARVFVLGHSQGGTFAPLVAHADPRVAGVVLMAAAAEPFSRTLVRQIGYLAGLGGAIGARARAQVLTTQRLARQIDDPRLARLDPSTRLLDGTGPAYWLSLRRYDEIATARALPQPLLLLQGGRDYQVTIPDDLDVWRRGLAGRRDVTVRLYPAASHLFIDGSGPSSPLEYQTAGHIDPRVTRDIAAWIARVRPRR